MHVAVFGSSGFLGSHIVELLEKSDFSVTRLSTSNPKAINPDKSGWTEAVKARGRLDGIVWAQGLNTKDSVLTTTSVGLANMIETNVTFISRTLKDLHDSESLNNPCRGVVVSSIWQELSRPEKFSYSVSKSALLGLVNSISIDMAPHGFAINSILPGVVDSPMTRANLSESSMNKFSAETPGGELVTGDEIANVVSFLLGPNSSGINSQSIVVDHGWSKARYVDN